MAKTVARSVFVVDPEDPSQNGWFHPGDRLPKWAEPLVTNAKAFRPLDGDADEDLFEEETDTDYNKLSADQLRMILTDRGLDTEGNKKTLVERLEAHDASLA